MKFKLLSDFNLKYFTKSDKLKFTLDPIIPIMLREHNYYIV